MAARSRLSKAWWTIVTFAISQHPHQALPPARGTPARNSLSASMQLSIQGPGGASKCPFQILPTSLTTHTLVTNRPTQAANSNKYRLGAGCTQGLPFGPRPPAPGRLERWVVAPGTQDQDSLPAMGL